MLAAHALQMRRLELTVDKVPAMLLHKLTEVYQRKLRR